jgi:hypothetical protein
MKPVVYCILDFFQSATSLISLCISSYGLAYSIGQPWMWNNIIVVACIATTISCNAFRQSFDQFYLDKYIIREANILKQKEDARIAEFRKQNKQNRTSSTDIRHYEHHYPRDSIIHHYPTKSPLRPHKQRDHSTMLSPQQKEVSRVQSLPPMFTDPSERPYFTQDTHVSRDSSNHTSSEEKEDFSQLVDIEVREQL